MPGADCGMGMAVILTHGAGGDMDHPQIVSLATCLATAGFMSLRFTCKGGTIAYRTKVYTAVLRYVYERRKEFGVNGAILAGRSMGSRAATGVANEQHDADMGAFILGVVCLAYPLHPPNEPDNLRDALLLQLHHSCLIVNGTQDAMCRRELMEGSVLGCGIPGGMVSVYWVEGADHGYKVKGRPLEDVVEEVMGVVLEYCLGLIKVTDKKIEKTVSKNTRTSSEQKDDMLDSGNESKRNKRKRTR